MKYGIYEYFISCLYSRIFTRIFGHSHVFICTQTIPNILLVSALIFYLYRISNKQLITNNYSKVSRKVNCIYLKTFLLLNNIIYRWNLVIILLFHSFYLQFGKTLVFDRRNGQTGQREKALRSYDIPLKLPCPGGIASPSFVTSATFSEDLPITRILSKNQFFLDTTRDKSHSRKLNGGLKIVSDKRYIKY